MRMPWKRQDSKHELARCHSQLASKRETRRICAGAAAAFATTLAFSAPALSCPAPGYEYTIIFHDIPPFLAKDKYILDVYPISSRTEEVPIKPYMHTVSQYGVRKVLRGNYNRGSILVSLPVTSCFDPDMDGVSGLVIGDIVTDAKGRPVFIPKTETRDSRQRRHLTNSNALERK